MVFGLGTKKVLKDTKNKPSANTPLDDQAAEAAAMLKKMEDKKAAGDCPFC